MLKYQNFCIYILFICFVVTLIPSITLAQNDQQKESVCSSERDCENTGRNFLSGLFSIGAVVGPHLFFRHPWSGIGNSLSAGVGSSDFLEIGGIANTDIILDEAHTDPGSRWSLMTFADIQLYRKDKANRINYGIGPGLTLHFKDLVFLTSIGPFIEGYESHSAVRTGAYVMQKIFHRWSDQRDIFFTIKASQTRWFTWSTGAGIIFKYGAGPKREGYSVEALYEENKALQSSIIIVKAGLLF